MYYRITYLPFSDAGTQWIFPRWFKRLSNFSVKSFSPLIRNTTIPSKWQKKRRNNPNLVIEWVMYIHITKTGHFNETKLLTWIICSFHFIKTIQKPNEMISRWYLSVKKQKQVLKTCPRKVHIKSNQITHQKLLISNNYKTVHGGRDLNWKKRRKRIETSFNLSTFEFL